MGRVYRKRAVTVGKVLSIDQARVPCCILKITFLSQLAINWRRLFHDSYHSINAFLIFHRVCGFAELKFSHRINHRHTYIHPYNCDLVIFYSLIFFRIRNLFTLNLQFIEYFITPSSHPRVAQHSIIWDVPRRITITVVTAIARPISPS